MNKIIVWERQYNALTVLYPFIYNGISGANDNLNTQGQWQKCLAVMERFNDQ